MVNILSVYSMAKFNFLSHSVVCLRSVCNNWQWGCKNEGEYIRKSNKSFSSRRLLSAIRQHWKKLNFPQVLELRKWENQIHNRQYFYTYFFLWMEDFLPLQILFFFKPHHMTHQGFLTYTQKKMDLLILMQNTENQRTDNLSS